MRLLFAAVAVALSIAPLHAQTSGPSGIQGVESDEFSPLMTIHGIVESENPLAGRSKTWNLRSFVGKFDGATTHQLYVGLNYFSSTRRHTFSWASDDTAMPLTVTPIASLADHSCSRKLFSYGCYYSEDIGIEVTTAALRAHAATGYRIKISAKSGDSFVLVISPNQIAAQLDTMQQCLEFVHAHSNVAVDQHRLQLFKTTNLGFKASEITDEIAAKTGLHKGPGIVVFEVTPGSLAERSGLKIHDRIMGVAGCGPSVNSAAAMKKCIANKKAYIGMVVDRGGDLTTVGMRLFSDGR
ncbi:MAG: PDZ domain-containing protein [Methylocella sp.]